ncbi:hypothetical protein SO802_024696 [Lithocarpus litseifolius]|uniref:Uncharacterized protein n=1 Tax=Lithocarpus litseifolius TaxID=425828 RepID=A0AAW2CBD2_9ROSI
MRIRRVVLQLQAMVEMGSNRGGMAASDQGGNGSFRLVTMASSDQRQWSLQTRSDGSGLIGEAAVPLIWVVGDRQLEGERG